MLRLLLLRLSTLRLPAGWVVRLALPLLVAAPLTAQTEAPIADNSFLIEEAYNQEAGVVQHVSTFVLAEGGEGWDFSFTQEWPLTGPRHQVGFTLPVSHIDPEGTGVGDVVLNYRYQLAGEGESPLYVAPRLSLLVPTGSEASGHGAGALGVQLNLPVSYVVAPSIATHWNGGAALGTGETTFDVSLGASVVWLARPAFNVLLEALWLSEGVPGAANREESAFLNPGIRWAHDFAGGLQIVPGLAYTIGLGPSAGEDALFLYLSFEHPFRRVRQE
ncbi:MAG TPA: transporter [Gemmatimonadales bacterium]|nr:transporter [Gemmatimonadales bacterium]